MNERIKELSKQAGDYVNETYTGPVRSKTPGKIWEDGHIGWHTQFNEKFAELIINECLACADRMADSLEKDEAFKEALGASWAGLAIARRYGLS